MIYRSILRTWYSIRLTYLFHSELPERARDRGRVTAAVCRAPSDKLFGFRSVVHPHPRIAVDTIARRYDPAWFVTFVTRDDRDSRQLRRWFTYRKLQRTQPPVYRNHVYVCIYFEKSLPFDAFSQCCSSLGSAFGRSSCEERLRELKPTADDRSSMIGRRRIVVNARVARRS